MQYGSCLQLMAADMTPEGIFYQSDNLTAIYVLPYFHFLLTAMAPKYYKVNQIEKIYNICI